MLSATSDCFSRFSDRFLHNARSPSSALAAGCGDNIMQRLFGVWRFTTVVLCKVIRVRVINLDQHYWQMGTIFPDLMVGSLDQKVKVSTLSLSKPRYPSPVGHTIGIFIPLAKTHFHGKMKIHLTRSEGTKEGGKGA